MKLTLPPSGMRTRAVHAGETPDPHTGASAPNLVMSTSFVADPEVAFSAEGLGAESPWIYTRWGNPTVDQLERKLADLEGAEHCVAFGSGMAAITALMIQHLGQGDHLLISDVTYAAAAELTLDLLPRMGIRITRVNTSDLEAVRAAVIPETRLIYIESPCNPLLRLTDIRAIAAIAQSVGAKLGIDSTFATPIATRPLELGADFVVHSLTKYLCGHGDAVGGAVLGRQADIAPLRKRVAIHMGGVLSPFNAWLILRGIATLPLRMAAHEQGALQVARFLEAHPRVQRVCYPGLPSHPQHDLARQQMDNFSGMLTFQVENGAEMAVKLAKSLKIIHYAVSLGHHRSLIFYLSTEEMLRHSFALDQAQEADYRLFAGEGVFRLSVGIEDPADLCADLEQALGA